MNTKKLRRRNAGEIIFECFLYGFFLLFTVTMIYPFWDIIMLSFANPATANRLSFRLWNDTWNFSSYKYLFSNKGIALAYFNTIVRTVLPTAGFLVLTMVAAYPLSKRDLPGRTFITVFFLITMFFSGGLIPSFLLIRNLGLVNTRWALIVPGLFGAYSMVLMRNYLQAQDPALEEAAFIDGAGFGTILWKIVVPLCKPLLVTLALWTAVGHWNDWFGAMIYVRPKELKVLQQLLREMMLEITADVTDIQRFNAQTAVKSQVSGPTVEAAMLLITIGPILAIYPFAQKYFVKGIMVGSLKG